MAKRFKREIGTWHGMRWQKLSIMELQILRSLLFKYNAMKGDSNMLIYKRNKNKLIYKWYQFKSEASIFAVFWYAIGHNLNANNSILICNSLDLFSFYLHSINYWIYRSISVYSVHCDKNDSRRYLFARNVDSNLAGLIFGSRQLHINLKIQKP